MAKLNPYIEKSKKGNNIKEHFGDNTNWDSVIDCCNKNNPYGFSIKVKNALVSLHSNGDTICNHNNSIELKEKIVAFWSELATLGTDQIVLTDGAMDSIYKINLLFHQDGASILGVSPQYTNYILNARLIGYNYRSLPLLKKDNYKFDVSSMLDCITSDLSLIYIDSPNNPTGQALSLNEVRLILDKAISHDISVIIDETYGDFIELEASAVSLLNRYDNLMVIRSFSKGLGLSGIRAGYIITSEYLAHNLEKISNPCHISGQGITLAKAALSDCKEHILFCCSQFVKSKNEIKDSIGGKLNMAYTLDSCPLLLLWHNDTTVNLTSEFAKNNIKVYSGSNFENLAANSVRLRLPHYKQMPELLNAVNKINNG